MNGGSRWAQDTPGILTKHGGWTLAYDSANRMKTSQPSGGSVTSYVYDADGRRVKKTTGSTSTYFVYDAFGQLAAEYSSTNPTGTTETHYLTTDHLGSTRLVTNQTGAVVSRHDYLPFGWELYSGLTGRTNGQGYLTSPEGIATPIQRFTGKERDSETRLDYFGARYYSAGPGRFTSADPKLTSGRPEDPQTWNRYSYVTNNPFRYVDPDGRERAAVVLDQDVKDFVAGRIGREEYLDRQAAKAAGAGIGVSIVGAALYGKALVGLAVSWVLSNPQGARDALVNGAEVLAGVDGPSSSVGTLAATAEKQTIRVIGHFPEYVETAEKLGARYFSIPEAVWRSMSDADKWTANRKYLDRAIGAGATIILATKRDAIKKGSYLEKEVEYLLANGYKWAADGVSLIPQ